MMIFSGKFLILWTQKISQDIVFQYWLECLLFVRRLYFGIVWIRMDFTAGLLSVTESVEQSTVEKNDTASCCAL